MKTEEKYYALRVEHTIYTICFFILNTIHVSIPAVTYIDSSAVQALKELHQEYKSRDIQVENVSLLLKLYKYASQILYPRTYFPAYDNMCGIAASHFQSQPRSATDPG